MLPTAEGRPRRIKMVPASGSQHLPESGRPGQPRGCHFGGGVPELSPACGKPSPCFPPVLCTGPTRSYSYSLCWLGKYASAEFWWPRPPGWGAKAPAWPGASWNLNTATDLSPPPSRLPDNRRGGRSHHSDGRPHGYP